MSGRRSFGPLVDRGASLAGKVIGTPSLFMFAVGASAPMTVLAGGVIATFAGTGVVGVPLSFLIIGLALWPLIVGYVAMSRHVGHAAMLYNALAWGLGRCTGVAGAAVALMAYNAIQIGLYGLVGQTLSGTLGGAPWWLYALTVWALIAALGRRHVNVTARLLAWLLVAEVVLVVIFNVGAFRHPAGGVVDLSSLRADHLLVNGVGGVGALGVAAFIGFELAPNFTEEARGERRAGKATYLALAFVAILYTVSSWAVVVAVGPDQVVRASRDQFAAPDAPNVVLGVLARTVNPFFATIGAALFVTSIFAAMLSFHNTVARYLFALGRERVLPERLATVSMGPRGGAPEVASAVQTVVALVVIVFFAVMHLDPIVTLFTWFSAAAAVAVIALLTMCSLAALRFFRIGGTSIGRSARRLETVEVRVFGPMLGVLAGAGLLVVMVTNMSMLLQVPPNSPLTSVIPGVTIVAALVGWGRGLYLRRFRPAVYREIGLGRPNALLYPEHRLKELVV